MKYFVVGGAGFIGSHLTTILLTEEKESYVTVYDNFSSGKIWHLEDVKENKNLKIIKADIKDKNKLIDSMKDSDIVYHFASNPDISKAVKQPDIDFWEGTFLTNNVLEAMRINGIKKLFYASGSGVYGDTGYIEVNEDYSPKLPISTYGASKLGCEALISSYTYMFDINTVAFRFANVVGPHQTHGVGYDFVRNLIKSNTELCIMGDGTQSKSYIYVTDVIKALRLLQKSDMNGFSYYNVSTQDYITVKDIASITTEIMNIKKISYKFTDSKRGWKGDVPIVRLNSDKIRQLGWKNEFTSKEAIIKSITSIYEDALSGKFKGE